MYSDTIKNKFIELRSQNVSLERIANQLGINKSTAVDWNRRLKSQIDHLRAFHLEAICERITTRYEDELEYALAELKRIRVELRTRNWDYEPTPFLFYAEAAAWRRVEKLRALAEFPTDYPADSSSDSSSEPGITPDSEMPNNGSRREQATPGSDVVAESHQQLVSAADVPQSKSQCPYGSSPSISHPSPHQKQGESEIPPAEPRESKIELPSVSQPSANDSQPVEDDFTGSVVINPGDSVATIVIKHLEAEATRSGRSPAG